MDVDFQSALMRIFALAIAIPIHEFAHALSAVKCGDDGPRRDGRISLAPWDHFDAVGAVFCVISSISGMGIGWGKPVMVNTGYLRNPKWDMCKIAAWGPLSNLLLAILFALPLRLGFGWSNEGLFLLLITLIQVNVGLMLFNLIPLGPLDGAKVLVAFLPDREAYEFSKFQQQWGMMVLFLLLTVGREVLHLMIGPPMGQLMTLLIGRPPFY